MLAPFRQQLGETAGIFGGAVSGLGDIAGQFGSMAQNPFGTADDPTSLGMQRTGALNQSRQGLERRGLGGSSILANEQARINQGFQQTGLGQQQSFLGAQAGLLGQQAGLSEQQANLELALPQIDVARMAAGASGGGGGTVICTLLHERSDMSDEVYAADCEFGKTKISEYTLAGYQLWATPLVAQLRKREWLYRLWMPIASTWAKHMAYQLGRDCGRRSYISPALGIVGVPACYMLGRVIAYKAAWKAWTTYAPPV